GLLIAVALVAMILPASIKGFQAWWLQFEPEAMRPIEWGTFSKAAVHQANAYGHHVLVSFWADWGISATRRERMIDTPTVRRLLRTKGITTLRADWSQPAPEIESELNSLGQKSIPLLVIYPAAGEEPIVLGELVGA